MFVWWEDQDRALDAQREPTQIMEALGAHITWVSRLVPGLSVVQVPAGTADVAVELMRFDVDVRRTTVDAIARPSSVPNDPHWIGTSTPVQFIQYPAFRSCLEAGWSILTKSEILVAVLDTGIDYTLSDMLPNIRLNPGETNNNQDDDADGIIDNIYGVEFLQPCVPPEPPPCNDDGPCDLNEASPPCEPHSDPRDVEGHGTLVASIIGARGNDGQGMAGIVWNVPLLIVKVLGSSQISWEAHASNICKGMEWAHFEGARIVNLSSGGSYGPGQTAAIWDPVKQIMLATPNTLYVYPSGNTGIDLDNTSGPNIDVYPQEFTLDNMIVVGGSNGSDGRASFSNYGQQSVDIFAPAVDIVGHLGSGGIIGAGTGTSFACPIVAGLAALRLYQDPSLSGSLLRKKIMENGDVIGALANLCAGNSSGQCGRVNFAKTLGGTCP